MGDRVRGRREGRGRGRGLANIHFYYIAFFMASPTFCGDFFGLENFCIIVFFESLFVYNNISITIFINICIQC
jgi:hypothetical protein